MEYLLFIGVILQREYNPAAIEVVMDATPKERRTFKTYINKESLLQGIYI